ncbi:hypothetical protein PG999_010799 [Apiospora kogelbergensis]|uniref:Uncharacterized protein n=1 Tax=Apiospora kogelbergensis TaxID=1337665 RepID=A0AAW0QB58_9PEZI
MDSPNSHRGKGRFSGRKRHTFPASSHSHRRSESSENLATETPAAAMAPSSSFSFETPSPSNAKGTRTRPRNLDPVAASPDDAGSKGGRSLRKRTRIDYSFDQVDDEVSTASKAPPTTTRSLKKRKTDFSLPGEVFDHESESRGKRRASEQPAKSASKRSQPRKTTLEPQPFVAEQLEEDVPVQDTIEVGGHHSEVSDESFHQRTNSGSSHTGSAGPLAHMTHDEDEEAQKKSETAPISDASHTALPEDEAAQKKSEAAPISDAIRTTLPAETKTEFAPDSATPAAELPLPKVEVEEPPDAQMHDIGTTNNLSVAKPDESPEERPEEKSTEKDVERLDDGHEATPEEMLTQEKPAKSSPKRSPRKSSARKHAPTRSTVEKEENRGPYHYLTPYIEGSKVLYPAAVEEEAAEPEVVHEAQEDLAAFEPVDEGGDEDTPAGTPAATANNSPAPEAEAPVILPPAKKQYQFKQPRPAEELTSLFDDLDSLSEVDLYDRLAAVNHVLVAWQEEWVHLRKIVDDEDNSVKYQAEEAAFLQREKMALSKDPDALPLRKDYQIKGIRAPKEDSMVLYARQQDRVMASAYLFEYDDRDSKIGMQDPIGQRRGVGKGRLRDRPKQTAKAAELDDVVNPNVVHGKRTRKPVNLFGDVEATSRSSTPVPTQPPPTKRRRGRPSGEENGDSHLSFSSQPEAPVEETPKKRGRGGRVKKPNPPTSVPEDPSTDNEAQVDPDEVEERPSRKRRRKAPAHLDEDYLDHDSNEHEVITGRSARARRHSRLTEVPTGSFYSTTSMPSTQGHDESRPNTSSSTATASTTVSTYGLREKRQKKFSNGEKDGYEDVEDQRKPKRTRRPTKKTQVSDYAEGANDSPEPAPEPTPEPAVVAPKMTKIKIKNFNGNTGSFTSAVSAPTSHPASVPMSNAPGTGQLNHAQAPPNGNGVPAHGSEAPKDYGSMTKSEKMSASMKGMLLPYILLGLMLTKETARWASGSMSPAVAKRRATLAAKKAAAKTPIPEFHPGAVFQQHRATHPHPHPHPQ